MNNTQKNSIIDVLTTEPKKEVKQVESPLNKPLVDFDFKDKKKKGCMPNAGCGCGCRSFSCFGCFFFLLLIIGAIYLIIAKPPFIWSEVVSFLNNGQKLPEYTLQSAESVKESLNSRVSTLGNVYITLTQDEVTTLLRSQIPQLTNLTSKIEQNKIKLYWILDNSLPAKPLLGIIEITTEDYKNFKISKIGTGRIDMPAFLNSFAENTIYSLSNLNSNIKSVKDLLSVLFTSENIKVNTIKPMNGEIEINANISVNLFN